MLGRSLSDEFAVCMSPPQLVGFVYACYVISIFSEEEDSCKYWPAPFCSRLWRSPGWGFLFGYVVTPSLQSPPILMPGTSQHSMPTSHLNIMNIPAPGKKLLAQYWLAQWLLNEFPHYCVLYLKMIFCFFAYYYDCFYGSGIGNSTMTVGNGWMRVTPSHRRMTLMPSHSKQGSVSISQTPVVTNVRLKVAADKMLDW